MTTAPHWSPVDDDTASLLSLVANDEMTDHADREWHLFVSAVREAAASDDEGLVRPNTLRPLVRGRVAPRRIGAFVNRAKAERLLVDAGKWQISDDTEGRNAGRPCRVYALTA